MARTDTPSIRVDIDLGPEDIAYFRERLTKARKTRALKDDDRVILGAEAMASMALEANPPLYIRQRIETLQTIVAMLKDRDWLLGDDDRKHVLDMLAYFADPKDIVPDDIPVLGLLDDAIMIDLAAYELAPELEAYSDFLENMEDLKEGAEDAEPIDAARSMLQKRMRRRRRRRSRAGRGEADLLMSLFNAPD